MWKMWDGRDREIEIEKPRWQLTNCKLDIYRCLSLREYVEIVKYLKIVKFDVGPILWKALKEKLLLVPVATS
jgi:hypothetical protein